MGDFKYVLMHEKEKMLPYFVMLSMIENIGAVTFLKIEENFDSPKDMFETSEEKLESMGIFSKGQMAAIRRIRDNIEPYRYYEIMQGKNIKFVSCVQDEYPKRLTDLYDKPTGLFYIGKLPDEAVPAVGVIGARECSFYGEEVAGMLGETLGKYGIPVISGMARGIDSISQMSALEAGGSSFALLGGGVDIVYPKESRALYEKLKTNGGIISEYPIGSQPLKMNFVRRNRLISGFSDTLLVVEAKKKSGTLTTVDFALEQGRDVACVPGRITDKTSMGCNELLRQGAELVNDPEAFARDILKKWGIISESEELTEISISSKKQKELSFLENTILNMCGDNSFLPEELLNFKAFSQYSNSYELMSACMSLSFENLLINMGGGRFRISREGINLRNMG